MPSQSSHSDPASNPGHVYQQRNAQGRRLTDKPTPPAVQRYLGGLDYPCSKQELIEYADQNDAPQDVMDVLEAMPGNRFNSPVEVSRAIADAKW